MFKKCNYHVPSIYPYYMFSSHKGPSGRPVAVRKELDVESFAGSNLQVFIKKHPLNTIVNLIDEMKLMDSGVYS